MTSCAMGNASSTGSSSSSDISSYNEGSNSPIRSPDTTTEDINGGPYLQIINEPYDKFRFRYKTEMQGTHGAILANNYGKRNKKEYPKVKLCKYNPGKEGYDPIIRCTLFTADEDEDKRVAHVHRLIGKVNGVERDDPHDFIVHGPSYIAELKQLTILFTKKEDQERVLIQKKQVHALKKLTDSSKSTSLPFHSTDQMRQKVLEELASINLNVACLRFDALIDKGHGVYVPICKPVYSVPINNMKNPHTSELKICRVDKCSGSCFGGEEVFMFVEKVVKKNIKVKFYEEGPNKEIIWEDYGVFTLDDVHHQYGIAFRTPRYRDPNITNNVEVSFQLERPSDKAVSEPRTFEYRPHPNRMRDINRKRPRQESVSTLPEVLSDYRPNPQTSQEMFSNITDDFLAPFITINQNINSDEILNLCNMSLPMDVEDHIPSLGSSSEASFSKLLDNLPSADSDAISQFLSNERFGEYATINGEEVAGRMLECNRGQVTGGLISDLVFDGFCSLSRRSTIPKSSSDNHQAIREENLVQFQMDTGNSTIPTRVPSRTPAELVLNENNIVEKIECALNNLMKVKKIKKMKEKFFQSCLIRLFSYTVGEESDDSVLHVLAASNETPVPIQAAKFLNLLKVFNVIDSLINIQNSKEETPLLVAAGRGSPHMVSLFLEAGANINATDIKDNTALHLAVLRDSESMDVVAALLPTHPNLIKYNEDGFTALHLAVYKRKSDVISALLCKSEDELYKEDVVNKQDRKRGNTALHIAVENRFKEVVKLLLNFDEKIEIDAMNFEEKTPLAFVLRESDQVSQKIVELLLANKADPNLVYTEKSKKEEDYGFEYEPELEIIDAGFDESESQDEISAYAREWANENELFDKKTISKLCPILDKNDDWIKLFKRLKFSHSEIDYCKIHWSPSLSAFKLAELSKPNVTAEAVRDELFIMAPHLRCGAQFIDDMLLRRLGLE